MCIVFGLYLRLKDLESLVLILFILLVIFLSIVIPRSLNYEDKQTLKRLYEPFPELRGLYEKFIDKNLEESYNLEIGDKVLRLLKARVQKLW